MISLSLFLILLITPITIMVNIDDFSIDIFKERMKSEGLFDLIKSIKEAYGQDVAIISCEELNKNNCGNCKKLVTNYMPDINPNSKPIPTHKITPFSKPIPTHKLTPFPRPIPTHKLTPFPRPIPTHKLTPFPRPIPTSFPRLFPWPGHKAYNFKYFLLKPTRKIVINLIKYQMKNKIMNILKQKVNTKKSELLANNIVQKVDILNIYLKK